MAGWEQVRKELNQERAQEQARQKRYERHAKDAANKLVGALDPRIKQFVQTLHDHDQWPTESKRVTEKQRVARGLLFTRYEEKTVTKTVTEPSKSIIISGLTLHRYSSYVLRIFSTQGEWALQESFFSDSDYGFGSTSYYSILKHTAKGTQVEARDKLVRWSGPDQRIIEPVIDLDALSNALIKQMANYLIQRGLPLPQD